MDCLMKEKWMKRESVCFECGRGQRKEKTERRMEL